MVIQLSLGKHETIDADNLTKLKMVIPYGWSASDIQRELPFTLISHNNEHVWISEEDLRGLCLVVEDQNKQDTFLSMISKAKSFGFYDLSTGSVRVHIEYY